MIHDFKIEHISIPGADRVFTWDDVTGTISGRDADLLLPDLIRAKNEGDYAVAGHISVKIKDPFHNLGELALIAFDSYKMTPEMEEAVAALPWPRYKYRDDVDY